MDSELASRRAFWGVSGLLFAGSAAVTIAWCVSMSGMDEMVMPGGAMSRMAMPGDATMSEMAMPAGGTMSMWKRMPGQTWPDVAAAFVGMWVVMMAAMMLPSFVPVLWRYREAIGRSGELRAGWLTALVGAGYFLVWSVFGIVVFALGVTLATIEMQQPALARAVPIAGGAIVLMAGALQLTAWKAHHHACCREVPGKLSADAATVWRYGLRLGLHCSCSSAGLMAVLLVVGLMDLRAMAVIAAAITAERLARDGQRVARVIGVVVIGAGLFLIARTGGLV